MINTEKEVREKMKRKNIWSVLTISVLLGTIALVLAATPASASGCFCPPPEYYETIQCGACYLDVYYQDCCYGPEYLIYSNGVLVDIVPADEYTQFKKVCHQETYSLFGPDSIGDIIQHYLCIIFGWC